MRLDIAGHLHLVEASLYLSCGTIADGEPWTHHRSGHPVAQWSWISVVGHRAGIRDRQRRRAHQEVPADLARGAVEADFSGAVAIDSEFTRARIVGIARV
jgi:hypothetical protein